MGITRLRDVLTRLNLISLSVPLGVLVVSVVLPLHPIVRQAMIGILLIWFDVEVITGFSFWK